MECYQKCVELGNRCKHLGSKGSCTDCGKISRSNFLTTPSQNCKCKDISDCTTCQDEPKKEAVQPTSKLQSPPTSKPQSPPSSNRESVRHARETQEKQSWWQWLLSLVGLGGQSQADNKTAVPYDASKQSKVAPKGSNQRTEIFSPEAVLVQAKDICNEIKNRKPELYSNHFEQSSPPEAKQLEEIEENKQHNPQSAESNKKRKGKSRSRSPSSPSAKYLGRPLESSPSPHRKSSPSTRKEKSPSRKPSPTRTEKSPARKVSPTRSEKPSEGAESNPVSTAAAAVLEKKRAPTSPIYSSERYLKEYTSELCCSGELSCSEVSLCSPKSSPRRGRCRKRKSKSKKRQKSSSPSRSCSNTMPVCCCPVCCPQICPPPCCPQPCIPPCPPKNCCDPCSKPPSCPSCSCSFCSSALKSGMRKRNNSKSPCGGGGSQFKSPKRRRSSSCPSSPSCPSRPCPMPCAYPCCPPAPTCRTPCPCPAPTPTRRRCGRSPCPSPSPRCPKPCVPNYPSLSKKSSCRAASPNCQSSCQRSCSGSSDYASRTGQMHAPNFTTSYPMYTSGVCSMNSYSRSRDSDALCRQLMAKYNISAPEPKPFCPIPRLSKCQSCDYSKPREQIKYPSSPQASGCKPCFRNSCYNNNTHVSNPLDCLYDTYEYCSYSSKKFSSASEEQNNTESPVTYTAHPSRNVLRMDLDNINMPKRTPATCIKQTGPRSPCQEYMSTYSFVKEHNKRDSSQESTNEMQENNRSPSKTAVKKSKRSDETQNNGAAENVSGNKTTSDIAFESVVTSDFLRGRKSRAKVMKKNLRSGSTESPATTRAIIHKSNQSPTKMSSSRSPTKKVPKTSPTKDVANSSPSRVGTERTQFEKRYSYSTDSKRYCPTSLTSSNTSHSLGRPKSPSVSPRRRQIPSPKSASDYSPSLGMSSRSCKPWSASGSLSLSFNQSTSSTCNYHRPQRTNDSHNFDMDYHYPRAKWNFSSSLIKKSPQVTPLVTRQGDEENIIATTTKSQVKDEESTSVKDSSMFIKETESSTILPKVESISTMVEQYDSVEVSAIGVTAQPKCKIFDYISAESSTTTILSVKEDPSLSIIAGIAAVDYACSENEDTLRGESHEQNPRSTTSEDIGTDIDDMSKIDRAHGDNHDQRKDMILTSRSNDAANEMKATDTVGDELRVPDSKLESFTEKIGMQNYAYICMAGESSVDPVEYGTIGESAVDPTGIKHKRQVSEHFPNSLSQCNYSNNKPTDCSSEPKVDQIGPMTPLTSENREGAESVLETSSNRSNNHADSCGEPNPAAPEQTGNAVGESEESDAAADAATQNKEETKPEETKAEGKPPSLLDQLLSSSGVKWAKVNEATETDIKLLHMGKNAFVRRARNGPKNNSEQVMPTAAGSSSIQDDPNSKPFLQLLKPGEIEDSDPTADQMQSYGTPV